MLAALVRDRRVHGLVGAGPSLETGVRAVVVMAVVPPILTILRTVLGLVPDAAIAALPRDDSVVGAGRCGRAEAEYQCAKCKCQFSF